MDRKEKILGFINEESYKPLSTKEISMILEVPKEELESLKTLLFDLESEGKIVRTLSGRYQLPEKLNIISGKFQGNERGFGFIIPDNEELKDIFIPANSTNGAMNGDIVLAKLNRGEMDTRRPEGEIFKIIEHRNKKLVGTYEKSKHFGFVIPDDKKIPGDIFIPKNEESNAKNGDKVVVEILEWPEARRNAEGKIIEVLGNSKDVGVDILSIIRSYNLEEDFPRDVLKQIENIPDVVVPEDLANRRDLRNIKMVTIDGEDAKDLDDAVSLNKNEKGNYILGVHIADVSHYVREDTPLDKEAHKRGTSVYLVDRVIPMLPRKLSNGICSLNAKVDRLAFTCQMEIDPTGKTVGHEIFKSVINIDERMTYTNVTKILVDKDPETCERYKDFIENFKLMEELALKLRNKRFTRGSIDFDFPEAKVILDEKGKPIDVKRYEITISNKIIEEFMLIANETVAEKMFWLEAPFLYRIHELPDAEKIENLNKVIYNFGYHIKGIAKLHPKALQEIVESVKGKTEEKIVSTLMLRSLQKAKYSPENLGHFGLAATYYSHFTSPIRRYPDLFIHRVIGKYIEANYTPDEKMIHNLKDRAAIAAKVSSETEYQAELAERDTVDLKKVEYMQPHVGDIFEGIISSVTSFGFFVELENTIEGLVRVDSIEDDYYVFNEKILSLIGERTKKVYKIGDIVKVQLAKADIVNRKIDFVICNE